MNPRFGPARSEDLATLVSIDEGSPQAWSIAAFEEELRHDPPTLFVLRRENRAAAFVVIRRHPPEMDIVNLAVDSGSRRLGFGLTLLRSLLDQEASAGLSTAFLEVRESNAAARNLYLKAGFLETQKRRGFYRNPVEDAILMSLQMSHQRG